MGDFLDEMGSGGDQASCIGVDLALGSRLVACTGRPATCQHRSLQFLLLFELWSSPVHSELSHQLAIRYGSCGDPAVCVSCSFAHQLQVASVVQEEVAFEAFQGEVR